MARIRTVKAEFWSDSKTGTLSPLATKLFLGLLNFSDDYGIVEFDPEALRVRIMPYYQSGSRELILEPLFQELIPSELVFLGKFENREFLWIKNFKKHQKVDHPGKALISENPDQNLTILANPRESSLLKGLDSKGMEGNGLEGKGWYLNGLDSKHTHRKGVRGEPGFSKENPLSESFKRFWEAYPRKQAKSAALKVFNRLNPDATLLEKMIIAINASKNSEQWRRGVIPHPATWLNQQRWDDVIEPAYPEATYRTLDEVEAEFKAYEDKRHKLQEAEG